MYESPPRAYLNKESLKSPKQAKKSSTKRLFISFVILRQSRAYRLDNGVEHSTSKQSAITAAQSELPHRCRRIRFDLTFT